MMILVIVTMLYAAFQATVAQEELRHVYSTLSERCESPAFFDRESVSCVIMYQVP